VRILVHLKGLHHDRVAVERSLKEVYSGLYFEDYRELIHIPGNPASTVHVATVDDEHADDVMASLANHKLVQGCFPDLKISSAVCASSEPAVGTIADVTAILRTAGLGQGAFDGSNVGVALVDSGINSNYLGQHSPALVLSPDFWVPVPPDPNVAPRHGTENALLIGLSAPHARLLVAQLFRAEVNSLAGFLSDAMLIYGQLHTQIDSLADADKALVVNNSWALKANCGDTPVGTPTNYGANPNHPFNLQVTALEAAGADIIFAAGNCGQPCPDANCDFGGLPLIEGANSLSCVTTVAGVDLKNQRVTYSSNGPGAIEPRKPDLAFYTHFTGSGELLGNVDSGTSVACPLVAGIVAAIRTHYKVRDLSPADLRKLMQASVTGVAGGVFDNDLGFGILDPHKLLSSLPPVPAVAAGTH
jgi:subtilisin family serine protease